MARTVTTEAEFRSGVLTIHGRAHFDVTMAKRLQDGPCKVTVTQRGC